MRYIIKGGIWKNAEDEVLKAAVMKYGLNQWSRISSLLVRKSAKECKARWYEWLDPSIKKTEWNREEEEKLLHLAKIFPCQWRTIAPILQRTPAQCVEHYEKLLDRAQGKEEQDENDPRKLRPGEINPNPEAEPARPDEIDMDEDVKEMLQEARARLANTRGKKAKRKAREKILDEARRLANLQKKRELKAAGIDFEIPVRRKVKEMDYNIEIPFQRIVPEGRFKTGSEEEPASDPFKSAVSLQQIEGKRRDEELQRRRLIDQKQMKKLKDKNMPKALSIINSMSEAGIIHKRQLELPEPLVSDGELLSIAKMTQTSTTQSIGATKVLLGNYTQREPTPMVMRTPAVEDPIMREAQNALLMRESQTPLIGGTNAQIKTPQVNAASVPRTPNTLLRAQRDTIFRPTTKKSAVSGEPVALKTDTKTDEAWEQKKEGALLEEVKQANIKDLLKQLPNPQNEYNFEPAELEEEEPMIEGIEEDKEDIEKRKDEKRKKEEELETQVHSLVIGKNLPRPLMGMKVITPFGDPLVSELIDEEMMKLVEHDNYSHPGKNIKTPEFDPELEVFSKEELINAKDLILEEQKEAVEEDLFKDWEEMNKKFIYFPGDRMYDTIEGRSTAELVEAKSKELKRYSTHFERLRKNIGKLEAKVENSLNGYIQDAVYIAENYNRTLEKYEQEKLRKVVFETLKVQEEKAIRIRVDELQSFLKRAEETEEKLQKRYKQLNNERNKLRGAIADKHFQ
jgi:pre-mRNA-splicing factor CDC5/CEF1